MGDPSLSEPPVEWLRKVCCHAQLTVQQLESQDVCVNPDHPRTFSGGLGSDGALSGRLQSAPQLHWRTC